MPPRSKRAATATSTSSAKPNTTSKSARKPKPAPAESPASDAESSNDFLSSISGIAPKVLLADGETREAKGSGDAKYTLKRTGDHYYCTCPSWRNAGGAPDARTCKHLKALLGDEYEEARLNNVDPPRTPPETMPSVSGIAPKVQLADGETRTVKGSGKTGYTVKRTSDHYYCSCPGWKMKGGSVDTRTCKHLKALLGEEYEEARIRGGDAPAAETKAGRKRKAGGAAGEEEGDDDDKPAKKARAKPATAKLKDTSFKPLLAHKWDLNGSSDPTGWHMSEKLDGVRAIWHGDKGTFLSREGNPFYAPDWFVKGLPKDHMLDGELFTKRGDFQNCVGIVKAQNRPEKWKFSVSYQIFDVPSMGDKPFEERVEWLESQFSGKKAVKWVSIVDHEECRSKEHLLERLDDVTDQGAEGLMLREPGSLYVEGRSRTLLKVKKFFDADAIVRGYEKGTGKNANCTGALRVEMLDDDRNPTGKTFKIGTGLTDKQRRDPPKIGTVVIYKYQELTKDGVPRFPSYGGERAD